MYYDSGTWSNVPLIVIVMCKIFIDTWYYILIVSVRFCGKHDGVFSPVGVREKGAPCVIFAFEVNLGDRV